jgi:hypothetical protein
MSFPSYLRPVRELQQPQYLHLTHRHINCKRPFVCIYVVPCVATKYISSYLVEVEAINKNTVWFLELPVHVRYIICGYIAFTCDGGT